MTQAETADCELLWPYPLLWFADHWGQDYLEFMTQMMCATGPAQVVDAERALADQWLWDLTTVWRDLSLIPARMFAAAARIDADQTPGA